MELIEYKPGDKVEVIGLPDGQNWVSPTYKSTENYLKNGDILEIASPPMDVLSSITIKQFNLKDNYCVKFISTDTTPPEKYIIPREWVRPVGRTSTPKVCECDMFTVLMVSGCQCGAITTERNS